MVLAVLIDTRSWVDVGAAMRCVIRICFDMLLKNFRDLYKEPPFIPMFNITQYHRPLYYLLPLCHHIILALYSTFQSIPTPQDAATTTITSWENYPNLQIRLFPPTTRNIKHTPTPRKRTTSHSDPPTPTPSKSPSPQS